LGRSLTHRAIPAITGDADMKEQRGIKTSRFEERVQLNTIVYDAFKKALKAGLQSGVDKNLPYREFVTACGLRSESADDIDMKLAYDVVVLGHHD
jgi:hypothetical protein